MIRLNVRQKSVGLSSLAIFSDRDSPVLFQCQQVFDGISVLWVMYRIWDPCWPVIEAHLQYVHLRVWKTMYASGFGILNMFSCMLALYVCVRTCLYSSSDQTSTISGGSAGRDFKQFVKLISLQWEKSSFLLPSTAGIALKQPDNGGVVLCPLNKLLKGQFTWERHTERDTLEFIS